MPVSVSDLRALGCRLVDLPERPQRPVASGLGRREEVRARIERDVDDPGATRERSDEGDGLGRRVQLEELVVEDVVVENVTLCRSSV